MRMTTRIQSFRCFLASMVVGPLKGYGLAVLWYQIQIQIQTHHRQQRGAGHSADACRRRSWCQAPLFDLSGCCCCRRLICWAAGHRAPHHGLVDQKGPCGRLLTCDEPNLQVSSALPPAAGNLSRLRGVWGSRTLHIETRHLCLASQLRTPPIAALAVGGCGSHVPGAPVGLF